VLVAVAVPVTGVQVGAPVMRKRAVQVVVRVMVTWSAGRV
jgi:hypothetical protein